MTIEQKAKRYDEALKWMRSLYPTMIGIDKEDAEHFFPELRESEDERIRGAIIDHLKDNNLTEWAAWLEKQKVLSAEEEIQGKKDVLWCIKQASKYAKDENEMGTCWFAEKWLEKQCEQKPTDEEMKELLRTEYEKGRADALSEMKSSWGEEDEDYLAACIDVIHNFYPLSGELREYAQKLKSWLKSLKDRVQPKQEWSEEDKRMLDLIIAIFEVNHPNGYFKANELNDPNMKAVYTEEIVAWLKSLKKRITYKQ